jgi:hypothetical protein
MESTKCQIYCMKPLSDGVVKDAPKSFVAKVKVVLTRRLGPARKRAVKRYLAQIRSTNLISRMFGRKEQRASLAAEPTLAPPLQAGDIVCVKTREEITATLGPFNDLKGLAFMPEMWQYCGTQQRVLKPLVRFVDERELRVRRAKGVVLLEGLMCEGSQMFGPCDRSCFFFWREEWLEKID